MTTNTPSIDANSTVASFSVSDSATRRIAEIISEQALPASTALRVAVDAGGCNGFQYRFQFDETCQPDDIIIEKDGVHIVVDAVSLSLLEGAQLEYVDKLMGAHFAVTNPNATSACGCGASFSLD